MSQLLRIIAGLTALTLSVVAYAFCQQKVAQARLDKQLQQLDKTLIEANGQEDERARNTLKGLESLTENQAQPQDIALLQAAQGLRRQTQTLLNGLHAQRATFSNMFWPGESGGLPSLRLQHQVAAYLNRTQLLYPADSVALALSPFSAVSTAAAGAALSQLEADVLAHENSIQRHIARHLGAASGIPGNLKILATAQSNTVAPGELYRAELFMSKILRLPDMRMYCNGQPVAVGPDGIAHVRFQAPTRPGPATWKATIRIRITRDGIDQDSVFQAQIAYRVARR